MMGLPPSPTTTDVMMAMVLSRSAALSQSPPSHRLFSRGVGKEGAAVVEAVLVERG